MLSNVRVRLGLLLWLAGLLSALAVMPYALALQGARIDEVVQRTGLPFAVLVAVSLLQSAIVMGIVVSVGTWASGRVGLRAPWLTALLGRGANPPMMRPASLAIAVGVAAALTIAVLDAGVFAPVLRASMPEVAAKLTAAGARVPWWQGLLASFYGGIGEELQLRWFVLPLLALGWRTLQRRLSGDSTRELSNAGFWIVNVLTAVLFGLGHLPATAAIVPLTGIVVLRAVVLNGFAGIAFGWLLYRNGLEMAMLAHFAADVCLHVGLPLVVRVG